MSRILVYAAVVMVLFAALLMMAAKGDAAAGKSVFATKCATCHGAQGEGREAIGKMLKVTLRHLGSKEVQAKSDAQLRKDILEGNGKMRPVKLADDDVSNVLAYMRTLKQK